MQLKIKNQEDFWAGMMFIAFGVVAMWISRDYPLGSTMRMGPGYFPTALGAIMAFLGAIILLLSFKTEGEKIKPFAWRGMILLGIAFTFIGWGMDHIGFVPSLFGMIVFSALAGKEFRLKEVLVMSVVLIAGSVALFIYGLDLPFPLFWWR